MKNKISILAAISLLGFGTLAHGETIQASLTRIQPSEVESVFNVQKESAQQPGIRLVKVDKGGTAGVESQFWPSSLFLTFHRDGATFDLNTSFGILEILDVLSVKNAGPNKILVEYNYRGERLNIVREKVLIDYTAAAQEALSPKNCANKNCELESAITVELQ